MKLPPRSFNIASAIVKSFAARKLPAAATRCRLPSAACFSSGFVPLLPVFFELSKLCIFEKSTVGRAPKSDIIAPVRQCRPQDGRGRRAGANGTRFRRPDLAAPSSEALCAAHGHDVAAGRIAIDQTLHVGAPGDKRLVVEAVALINANDPCTCAGNMSPARLR